MTRDEHIGHDSEKKETKKDGKERKKERRKRKKRQAKTGTPVLSRPILVMLLTVAPLFHTGTSITWIAIG